MPYTVEICDFEDDEIRDYAINILNMSETDYDDVDSLIKEVENNGYTVISKKYYPNNDIMTKNLLERLNNNIGLIDKKALEDFLQKQGF